MPLVLFDLDDTLYSRDLGVVARIDRRINRYLEERMGIAPAEVDALRRRYWTEHGTTLRGLMIHHRVDAADYLEYVHDVDLSDVLVADPPLREMLDRLACTKAVFTNSSRAHARSVLRILGVDGCFDAVFCLEDAGYVPKPAPDAYAAVLRRLGAAAGDCALVDDTRSNLLPAKALGMRTVWVAEPRPPEAGIDHVIAEVHEIEGVVAAWR